MGCACNKQKPTGLSAKRSESAPPAEPRKAPEASKGGEVSTPSMHGRTQSFSMQLDGKTASFGSRLERDAAVARSGGRPV